MRKTLLDIVQFFHWVVNKHIGSKWATNKFSYSTCFKSRENREYVTCNKISTVRIMFSFRTNIISLALPSRFPLLLMPHLNISPHPLLWLCLSRLNLTLPVAVEPVNDTFPTSGSVQRSSPTDGVFSLEQGTTLNTPAGMPACSASYGEHNKKMYTISWHEKKPWKEIDP